LLLSPIFFELTNWWAKTDKFGEISKKTKIWKISKTDKNHQQLLKIAGENKEE
jgi:hypothetical protein